MSDSQNTSLNDNQSKTRRRNQPSNQRIKTRLRIQRKVPQSEQEVPQRRFGQIGGDILPREASMPRLGVNTTHILNPRANMPHPGVIVQPAMSVNAPNDQYEVEANQVADAVMRMPSGDLSAWTRTAPTPPKLQLQNMITRRRERVQRSEENMTPSVTPDVENRISQMDGGGQPLPEETRSFFESRMGADFSGVRVHTDGNAAETSQAIQARAFTSGNNIAFNSGEYNPGTSAGKHLLAHELTHTVQQGAAGELRRQPGSSTPKAGNLETVVRSMLEGQCPADPTPLLAAIQAASVTERQKVLGKPELIELFKLGLGDLATVYISALLEGSQEWKNPTANDFFNYFVTNKGSGTLPNTATMNCWESILYAAYLAGQIDAKWIETFYTDALNSGSDPNAEIWRTLGFSTGLPQYSAQKQPSAGQLVFYLPSESSIPSHVALSLGGDEAMSLWNQPNNVDSLQNIKVKDLTNASTSAFFGNPPW